jgi:DnaJ-domain-containing protein 1
VNEINERIAQRGWGIFFEEMLGNKSRRTSHVHYSGTDERFAAVQAALESCKAIGVEYVEDKRQNWDPKRYGGADYTITKPAQIMRLKPPFIDTNVTIWGIDIKSIDLKMLFFPDTLLFFQGNRYQAVPYEMLSTSHGSIMGMTEFSPHDEAEIVGQTWMYTNLDVGPDRKFSNNRRLLVVRYGLVAINVAPDLLIELRVLHRKLAEVLAECLQTITMVLAGTSRTSTKEEQHGEGRHEKDNEQKRSRKQRRPPHTPNQPQSSSAREILGVSPEADRNDIIAAYRKMARMYHPDKVAGLGPEFGELAERRMKEINTAYAELIQSE